ncbi:M20 family metallopeptidase [Lentilactobacillus sp. SPB1-3]|uniref:M20 family metallopeptidase n=1 Tax=Lentilactobacillus terminaliae TaxID=3003483 RepID=A0ACD5DG30_9LACO|nr:M20 family metallopeptidase [Lentilactobacillus sp. SPB1-3]MCZ0976622.1 M20 family metallopeptidase [Lentilactobacillus sp. SPB1-3]
MEQIVTEAHHTAAVEALKGLISKKSVYDEATVSDTTPFGAGIDEALTEVLKIAADLGFKTFKSPTGHYGYAEIGEGKETFGIIGHVDVVPAGDVNDWDHDPFDGYVENDKIFGRGSQDDKGPSVATMFAVKALMDAGYHFNKKIRFIFGTDEETLWRGIAVYNEKEDPIDMGIAPDAEFPLIYAEKGLDQAYLVGPGMDNLNIDLKGAFNAVPAKAEYNGPKLDEVKQSLEDHGFEFEDNGEGIVVTGKSVHAMLAPTGTNAVLRLAIALDDVFPSPTLDFIGKLFKEDATGTNVLGDISDEQSGHLTFNISSLTINEKETRMQIDMRIPVTVKRDDLINRLNERVKEFGLKYEAFDYLAPLYVPTDSTLVKTLMSVYKEMTGDDTQPQVSGGATFARTMNNCVAFGAMLPDVPDFMHQVNENWPLKSMYKAMDIYAEAIKELCTD